MILEAGRAGMLPEQAPRSLYNVSRGNRFPSVAVFIILQFRTGNPSGTTALNDDEGHKGGRSSRKRGAERMIEQRPSPERRMASASMDDARLRQQAIGVRLRQMFDDVVSEDVPDEFLAILRRADERSSETS